MLLRQGFVGLADFNDPAKVASAPWAMAFIVWSDVGFGLMMLVSVFVLYRHWQTRLPFLITSAVMIVLVGVVGWFVAHDIGFHVIGWPAIERDPASTNYAMDRALWAVRNGVFFAASLLIVLAAGARNMPKPVSADGPLANSA